MTPVTLLEDAWDGTDEAALTNWFFEDGAVVSQGDLICEITVVKAALEVRAPTAGRLRILIPADTVIGKSATLAVIE